MSFSMYTAVAPVNIAVIKYWGKRNEDLILPVNDSISVTLSKDIMNSKTTVACCEHFKDDKIWLNGKEEDITNPRLQKCIEQIKKCSRNKKYLKWHLHICSKNNFPTAAGLASSAAGFACLVKALAALYDVDDELSLIARYEEWIPSFDHFGIDQLFSTWFPETCMFCEKLLDFYQKFYYM